jgi:hypothetical protein
LAFHDYNKIIIITIIITIIPVIHIFHHHHHPDNHHHQRRKIAIIFVIHDYQHSQFMMEKNGGDGGDNDVRKYENDVDPTKSMRQKTWTTTF